MTVPKATVAQTEIDALNVEYQGYIHKIRVQWLARNRINSRDVYEVMRSAEQATVHQRIAQWSIHITPLAEAWWKERGYGVIWPDDDSKPMMVRRL